ncbi:MAG: hypothetical protein U0936_07235 [Planctomycetaceae bacterium]
MPLNISRVLRAKALSVVNRRRILQAMTRSGILEKPLLVFIFTEELMHFARYCIPKTTGQFQVMLVLNGVTDASAQWMTSLLPERCIVRLKSSLSRNSKSMLSHAAVLHDLLAVIRRPFCIQDPDCFIIDPAFFDSVFVDEDEFAAGPFLKRPTEHDHILPDTFFLMLNSSMYHRLSKEFGVSAELLTSLPKKAMKAAQILGYQPGQFTEKFKNYFDTLQAYWIIAQAEGKRFRLLPGASKTVFHIGGTSYLHNSTLDLAHWDFWPLSVQYINLRLLEMPVNARFRQHFSTLFSIYKDADELVAKYPAFQEGYRYRDIHRILETCVYPQSTSGS